MNGYTLPACGVKDLTELLTLDSVASMRFRSRFGDANANDRAFSGQILGKALMAAARTVPEVRAVTAMQFLFLQGNAA